MCFHPYFTVLVFYTSPSPHVSAPSSARLTKGAYPGFVVQQPSPLQRDLCVCGGCCLPVPGTLQTSRAVTRPWGKQEWWHRAACTQPPALPLAGEMRQQLADTAESPAEPIPVVESNHCGWEVVWRETHSLKCLFSCLCGLLVSTKFRSTLLWL